MIVGTYFGLFMPALRPPKTVGDDPRDLQVRSRRRVDLERLRELYLPELGEVIQLKGTDYQFRAYCTREQWGQALSLIAADIDYVKFKDTPKERLKDAKLTSAYTRMWSGILDTFPTGSVYDYRGWRANATVRGRDNGGTWGNAPRFTAPVEHVTARLSDLTQDQRDRLWDEREPETWELELLDEHRGALWDMSEEDRRRERREMQNLQSAYDDHMLCNHGDSKSARKRCNRKRRQEK